MCKMKNKETGTSIQAGVRSEHSLQTHQSRHALLHHAWLGSKDDTGSYAPVRESVDQIHPCFEVESERSASIYVRTRGNE